MNLKPLTSGLILFALLEACSGSKSVSSSKQKKLDYSTFYKDDIVVNGNATDWHNVPLNIEKQSKIYYAVSNNDNAFYVLLKVSDPMQQMKILSNGMEVWIDANGKKNKQVGIIYPMSSPTQPMPNNRMEAGDRPDIKQIRNQLLSQKHEMELKGFKENINGIQDVSFDYGIQVSINWNEDDVMIYEARIPFNSFKNELKKSTILSVGFVINGLKLNSSNNNMGGMPPGGMGGGMRPPGGSAGNMPGREQGNMPGAADMKNQLKEISFWEKYLIAVK